MLLTSSLGCAREGGVGTEVRVIGKIRQNPHGSRSWFLEHPFAQAPGNPGAAPCCSDMKTDMIVKKSRSLSRSGAVCSQDSIKGGAHGRNSLNENQDFDDTEPQRVLANLRTSVPTPPSRAHPKDDARSKQLPQMKV